jgi:hypothetical protein
MILTIATASGSASGAPRSRFAHAAPEDGREVRLVANEQAFAIRAVSAATIWPRHLLHGAARSQGEEQ